MTDAHNEPTGTDDAAEDKTRQISSAPSPADEEKTQVVPRQPQNSTEGAADGATRRVDAFPPAQPPLPPYPGNSAQPQHSAPPQADGPPPRPTPPPPPAPNWGGAPGSQTPPPPPPPFGAPGGPPHQGPPPPPYPGQPYPGQPYPGQPPHPGQPPYAGQPPQPGGYPGGPSYPPSGPPPNAAASAQALLDKGNSFIARLMYRGVRGELIKQPWFQNFRHQQPDQFVYVSYGIALVLALVFALLPGLLSVVLSTAVWVGLTYLFFAVGTKKAHQFIVYGICLLGAVLSLLGALLAFTGALSLLGLPYVSSASVVLLLISGGISVLVAAVLGYVGLQVHRGIQRMSSAQ